MFRSKMSCAFANNICSLCVEAFKQPIFIYISWCMCVIYECTVFFHSENYLVRWGSKGFPKEIDMLNNLKVVFTVSDHTMALSHCLLISKLNRLEWSKPWFIVYLSVCLCPPGLGEQRPEQGEDLFDLSDSESGQDGPERNQQQEVHSGSEEAFWGGRY